MSLLHARTFRAAFMPEQAHLEGQLVTVTLETLTGSWAGRAPVWRSLRSGHRPGRQRRTQPRSRHPQQLVPEWPETRTPHRRCRRSRALTEVHGCQSVAAQGTAYPPMVYSEATKVLSNAPRWVALTSAPARAHCHGSVLQRGLAGISRLRMAPSDVSRKTDS
jgi:hypothetical protein